MSRSSDPTAPVPYLGVLIESPIQYHAPLFKYLANDHRFRLKVLYMSRRGVDAFYNKQLKMTLKWDIPVLEGYDHAFLSNHALLGRKGVGFWSLLNLGIPRALAAEKFDALCLYGHAYASCWLAYAASRALSIPLMLRGEGEDFFPRSPLKRAIRNRLINPLVRGADAGLYIGAYNRQYYINHGMAEDRLFHVPYCVDNEWFDTRTDAAQAFRKELRARLGLSDQTVVFVLASKHRPDRYPMDVIRAFCTLPVELDTALLIFGDGELRPQMEAYAREHGEGRKIHFAGMISQAQYPNHLGAGDVLVQPSSETWGCVINEAIAANLAVISSDQVLGWPDMIDTEVSGLVYPFHDTAALAQCMKTLGEQPERVQAMRVASRQVAERLSFQTCADGIAAALDRRLAPMVTA